MTHSHDLQPSLLMYTNNPLLALYSSIQHQAQEPQEAQAPIVPQLTKTPSHALSLSLHKRIQLQLRSSLAIVSISIIFLSSPCSSYSSTLYFGYQSPSSTRPYSSWTHINIPWMYQYSSSLILSCFHLTLYSCLSSHSVSTYQLTSNINSYAKTLLMLSYHVTPL